MARQFDPVEHAAVWGHCFGTFDPTKPCATGDGRPVRILCTDRKGPFPIVALVGNDDSSIIGYTADGSYLMGGKSSLNDLVNIRDKKVLNLWANVWSNGEVYLFSDRANAVKQTADAFLYARVPVTITAEEGQGVTWV